MSLAPHILKLESIRRSRQQLSFTYRIQDLSFHSSFWYGDVDLFDLERRFGIESMHRIYFHAALFDLSKLVSLRPKIVDVGPYERFVTPRLSALWRQVTHNILGQWRYENHLPHFAPPTLKPSTNASLLPRIAGALQSPEVLAFCGGGKDSLVGIKLLERGQIPYASFAYSHSIYGPSKTQHTLIDQVLDHCQPKQRHRMWAYDDFLDSPVVQLCPEFGTKTLIAGETPSTLFASLPLLLAHGYKYLSLGHEASANQGNLTWDKTGEVINHQWGKSLEAENLINPYIQEVLIEDVQYFGILQPIHDAVIFNLLNKNLDAVPKTHSCNIKKPWCGQCPKCAYVWMNYMAYLPPEIVHPMFNRNLFDVPENQKFFQMMLGLGEHIPFECIGQKEESQLAMSLCALKGVTGRAADAFLRHLPPIEVDRLDRNLLLVKPHTQNMPDAVHKVVLPQMHMAIEEARSHIHRLLESSKPELTP